MEMSICVDVILRWVDKCTLSQVIEESFYMYYDIITMKTYMYIAAWFSYSKICRNTLTCTYYIIDIYMQTYSITWLLGSNHLLSNSPMCCMYTHVVNKSVYFFCLIECRRKGQHHCWFGCTNQFQETHDHI